MIIDPWWCTGKGSVHGLGKAYMEQVSFVNDPTSYTTQRLIHHRPHHRRPLSPPSQQYLHKGSFWLLLHQSLE